MTPETKAARRAGAEGSRLGAEYVLLDPEGKMLRGLNPTGARIWELLDGRRTLAQIAAELAREHGTEASRVLPDVVAFVELLDARGLVDVFAAGSGG